MLNGRSAPGRSPASPPARSLDDYADDVHVLLDARGFAPAAVAGFSFGGMVAQHLALKYPNDVAALAICACPSTLKPENRVIAAERGGQRERDDMGVVLDATLDRWFTPEFRASGAADAARDRLLSDNVEAKLGALWLRSIPVPVSVRSRCRPFALPANLISLRRPKSLRRSPSRLRALALR